MCDGQFFFPEFCLSSITYGFTDLSYLQRFRSHRVVRVSQISSSLLRDGFNIRIRTISDISIFTRPPWELTIFFPTRTSTLGVGSFDMTRMVSFFKWTYDRYESILINERNLYVRHIKLTYVRHNAHADGSLSTRLQRCKSIGLEATSISFWRPYYLLLVL
ncbi:unnamed protein product [Arabis nemorensis]|uniref:Uncharacterized protein n=1 Tax=Arabis nemorensis TaxID=586526 RepID=A0A565C9D9_9BRAS|nr:unnamed protein product [Arabis nemorensis]